MLNPSLPRKFLALTVVTSSVTLMRPTTLRYNRNPTTTLLRYQTGLDPVTAGTFQSTGTAGAVPVVGTTVEGGQYQYGGPLGTMMGYWVLAVPAAYPTHR